MDLFGLQTASHLSWSFTSAATGLLMAFVVGVGIAVVYIYTFKGFSFSKSFIHSLVLSPIVASIAMMAIDGSLARGIGMMGAFSILRFRSNIRDPKDMFFLFASLSLGIACGVNAIHIASLGLTAFSIVIILLSKAPLSAVAPFDGVLRFSMPSQSPQKPNINSIIEASCRNISLISLREGAQGSLIDYVYQIKLNKNLSKESIVEELKKFTDVSKVQFILQDRNVDL